MTRVAFVFPGQGSQKVGMGKEAFDASPEARAVFDEADRSLGFAISQLCFEGPETELQLTANTQPALLTVSTALARGLGVAPDVVAGHSLGEYTAHVVAGTLAFDDALRLVRKRGQLMQEAVPVGQGAMAAVMGADRAKVVELCAQCEGIVEPVNFNSPGQTVIAGETAAVERATVALRAEGAKVVPIAVSAPFHSSMMRGAEESLAPAIEALAFAQPKCPIYVNVDAVATSEATVSRDALIRQISRAVRWEDCVRAMVADGVGLFVEIGPGKVLSGLIARIAKETQRISVQTPADFEAARAAIAAARS